MRARENTTQVREIYTSFCGQNDMISLESLVFLPHLAQKLNARADAKHTINFKRPNLKCITCVINKFIIIWFASGPLLQHLISKAQKRPDFWEGRLSGGMHCVQFMSRCVLVDFANKLANSVLWAYGPQKHLNCGRLQLSVKARKNLICLQSVGPHAKSVNVGEIYTYGSLVKAVHQSNTLLAHQLFADIANIYQIFDIGIGQ